MRLSPPADMLTNEKWPGLFRLTNKGKAPDSNNWICSGPFAY